MSDWGIGKGEWRDSRPYGNKIHEFIMDYPEWSIYLRKDHRFKCPDHADIESDTYLSFGQVDCSCFGLGVAISGSIVPCRTSRGRNAEVGPIDGQVRDAPGFLDLNQDVLHFPRAVLPQVNDIVLQCEWNTKAQKINKFPPRARPIRIHSIYVIRLVNSYFQRELSHFSCGVETLNIQADHLNALINNRLTNLPVIDVDSTWKNNTYWTT